MTGVLALTALGVPAAQADEAPKSKAAALTVLAPSDGDSSAGDTKITKVVVNGGKSLSLGTTARKTITAEVTATDPEGMYETHSFLWNGPGADATNNALGIFQPNSPTGTCTEVNATTTTCKYTIVVDPARMSNSTAGTWKLWVYAIGNDGDHVAKNVAGTTKVLRASTLTANAAPEPVRKGKPITVTGKLARASWDTFQYAGYSAQPTQLQFRAAGTSTYSTVKTVKTNAIGNLKTTVTAVKDGYWRWNYTGSSTSTPVAAAGDYLDVR
ncbi:calcium-binding protein [Streptomyces sp. 21So2-11]|uniref:calcium-binding protein n=1 Tax=Streptomyces sp. 21So2-11 TaxID=3144408 RepID=UPI00321AE03A